MAMGTRWGTQREQKKVPWRLGVRRGLRQPPLPLYLQPQLGPRHRVPPATCDQYPIWDRLLSFLILIKSVN